MADSNIQDVIDLTPWEVRDPVDSGDGMSHSIISTLANASTNRNFLPGYWSRARDQKLAAFSRESDPLKIAISTFISKASNVPLIISPRDRSVQAHIELSLDMAESLDQNSGFGRGFVDEFKRFLYDYLTQDNGAFMLILGRGRVTGPIVGRAVGLVHLPSSRCTRTKDPIYPIVYLHDLDGKRYKIHYTRVIRMVNLPSPDPDLRGVGLCSVSLCSDSARELNDIAVYIQEKLGSRPPRQILYAKTGATVDQLQTSIYNADLIMNNESLSRFAKTLLLAPKIPSGKLELETLDLTSVPDGFNRQSDTLLAMATIAAAFGLDLRDLAYSFGISGQTKSDAEIQHNKGLGKGVAQLLSEFSKLLTKFYLPKSLIAQFDYIDDAQDEASAEIISKRSTSRTRDIMGSILNARVAREHMLHYGEIDDPQFEELELMDGRLPDGTDVFSLFFNPDPIYKKMLALPAEDPTDINSNDADTMVSAIRKQLQQVWIAMSQSAGTRDMKKLRYCEAVLERLMKQYNEATAKAQADELLQQQMQMGIRTQPQKITANASQKNPTGSAGNAAKGEQNAVSNNSKPVSSGSGKDSSAAKKQ